MTLFWIAIAVAGLIAALWMARPFLRRTEMEMDEADTALSIYRDQAEEVERDLQTGLISPEEYDAARQEIEQRALKAARAGSGGFTISHRAPGAALALTGLALVAALGLYGWLGSPARGDLPLAGREEEALTRRAEAGDVASQIKLLIRATEEDPESFEDWWLLARSYAAVGDNASAAEAYRHAAELSDNSPAVLSAYGEAMTLANGNKVPQAANLIFQQVLRQVDDPRARYYVALAKAQAQNFDAALADWAALAADSQQNAPWMAMVRRDIVNMARFTDATLTDYLPDATPEEIAAAGGGGLTPADNGTRAARAAALEAALTTDPGDYKGWIELAQLRAALGQDDLALAAIEGARAHFAAAPFVLGKIDQAAAELGLDLLAAAPGVATPSAEDMAAVQEMSAEDQSDLIDGMVAGLAAKLEENPDNPDGWVMLVRSYVNLGMTDKATEAYSRAQTHFAGKTAILAKLEREAGVVLGGN